MTKDEEIAALRAKLVLAENCIEGKNAVLKAYRSGTWKGPPESAFKKIDAYNAAKLREAEEKK